LGKNKMTEIVVCTQCDGTGYLSDHSPNCDGDGCSYDCPIQVICDMCMGTGLIDADNPESTIDFWI
jgi:DnaJ-class molecular chaperone